MDINQAAKLIEWLDEERRRDRGTIAKLQENLALQQDTIDALTRRLSGLESEQTLISTQVETQQQTGPNSQLMDQVRTEMRNLLEQQDARRLTAEREAERRQEIAREGMMRPVRDLTERLQNIEGQLADLPGFQLERERTGEAVASVQQRIEDLYKQLEDPKRRVDALEEQRRQDARRLGDIQTNLPEMQKQIDTIKPKLTLIEELTLRNEKKINDTQTAESERREQMQQFIDQQVLMLQQRDQQVQALSDRFGEQDSAMQRNLERFEAWAETHRAMQRIIEDFERISDRLERRINEVAEVQRLSEERFREEWNDWRGDEQKRYKQFTLANDEVWRNHDIEFDRHVQRTYELEALLPPLRESISRLWNLERARAELYRERYQALLIEYDTSDNIKTTKTTTMPVARATTTGNHPAVNGINGNDES